MRSTSASAFSVALSWLGLLNPVNKCNVGGYPMCEFEGKREGKRAKMALRKPLERVLNDAEL